MCIELYHVPGAGAERSDCIGCATWLWGSSGTPGLPVVLEVTI